MPKTTICTHTPSHHCDEAMGVCIPKQLLEHAGQDVEILFSRNPADWERADIVVDVGGICHPKFPAGDRQQIRLDHHQESGAGSRSGVKYAAAGLSWKHFGDALLSNVYKCEPEYLGEVFRFIDDHLMCSIDCNDNGQSLYYTNINVLPDIVDKLGRKAIDEGIEANVECLIPAGTHFTLSHLVSQLNPLGTNNLDAHREAFFEGVELCQNVLQRSILLKLFQLRSKPKVERMVAASSNPKIVVLDEPLPWQQTLIDSAPEALICIHQDLEGNWLLNVVPTGKAQFESRVNLPSEWGALRGKALAEVCGVQDAVFVHAGLFVGGAASREGAIKMAELAVENAKV